MALIRFLSCALFAFVLAIAVPVPASAAPSTYAPTIVYLGGSLSFTQGVLTGTDVLVSGATAPTFQINSTESQSSWNVVLQMTPLMAGGYSIPSSSVTYTAQNGTVFVISGDAVDLVNGPKETGFRSALDAPVKCLTAVYRPGTPGTGSALCNWTPDPAQFTLHIPGYAMAGNYTATLVATISTGP